MALAPGTRLGPYEIVATLGVGGMGEVYRATDRNLKRQVALKVLPASVAGDTDRLARFQREAELLAALNHPHIAAIYGLEKSTGSPGLEPAGLTALVMELVEGEDLSQRIRRGAVPLADALPIARQIAEALEAAHEQGIVHRDLKPANIRLRADGTVKVLDFGLAKALDVDDRGSAAGAHLADSPTVTSPAVTMRGVLLGTAAYMSPEQAAGRPVDKRSDIWAFGVVLLEMLTGRPVFNGETTAHVLAEVLKSDPDWSALPPETPAAIRRLLRRCLEKERRRRLADAADVRLEVEEAMLHPNTDGSSATTLPVGRPGKRFSAPGLMAALAVLAAVTAAIAVPTLRYLREASPAAPETRTEIVTPATSDLASFALSPDGRHLAFVASGDGPSRLWLRSLSTNTAQALAGTEGATYPFWSPDSRSVAFVAGGMLRRLDLGGGAPQPLAPAPAARGGTWAAGGAILVAPRTTGSLMRVSATGGDLVSATTLGQQHTSHRWPFMLPDGQRFLFYANGALAERGIYLGALDGSAATRLTQAGSAGVFLSDSGGAGWLLWVRGASLVAQRLDVARRTLTGEAVTVAGGVTASSISSSVATVSANGLIAYRIGGSSKRELTWVDRSGKRLGAHGAPDENDARGPAVSPDGRRVAVSRTVQGNTDIWLTDGARMTRLTFDAGVESSPIWWNNSRIIFRSNRTGQGDIYQKLTNGTAAEGRIVSASQLTAPSSVSRDGRFLLYYSTDQQTSEDLWIVPLGAEESEGSSADQERPAPGAHTPSVFLKTPFRELEGVFSPDGRWVAYMSDESGQMEIYVRPFTWPAGPGVGGNSTGGPWQISTAGGVYPRWRPDGKELFYATLAGDLMAAAITVKDATLEAGTPVTLFQTRIYGGGVDPSPSRQYDIARDGRFLLNTVLDEVTPPITLIQNWRP